MRLLVFILCIFTLVGCAYFEPAEPMTPEEKMREARDLGWMCGTEFRRTQSPQNVSSAIKYTEMVLEGSDVMTSEDLINAGIKLYLAQNPEATIYYMVAKRALRLLGFKLPKIDVLKESGLDLKEISPEIINVFLEGFLSGVRGEVAFKDRMAESIDGQLVSPIQRNAVR
jgi:hypothetical protein